MRGAASDFEPFLRRFAQMETKLKCPICNNLLEEPKLLPCDHIICQNCLPAIDGKRPTCPECGKLHPKNARGSLHVEEMIKIFNEMDAAISDIFKQIMSDKCPIGEDHETKATHKKGKGLELVWSEQHPSLMRPKEPGTYSPEMFCANELPYMIKQGHKPTAVFDAALTPNPKVSISPMAKVVKERDYFRNKCNTID